MSPPSFSSSDPSKDIKPTHRLASIKGHMDGGNPTVFTSDHVPQAPEDPLFGLMAAYRKDTFDKKVDLGIGAYRDNNAKPWVLPVVKQVGNTLRPTHSELSKLTASCRLMRGCGKTQT